MNKLVKRYVEDYQDVYAYKNIEVHVEERGQFVVRMNDVLAGILITNLLKNAFVHNIENGSLYIDVTSHSIRLRNSAEHGSLDEKRIFERFYHGHKKEGSSGLGLALVDAVCRHSCIQIRYYYEEGWHIFEINC